MAFPSGLTPLLRFDARQTAYEDAAQTTVAAAPTGRVRSLPQPSPLSGSWVTPNDASRTTRSAIGTIACEPIGSPLGQYFNAPGPASAVSGNNCTIAISFRAFVLYNGSENALITTGLFGIYFAGNGLALRYNGGALWSASGISLGKDLNPTTRVGDAGVGNLICIVARWSPTGIDIYVDEEGTVSTASLTTTVNASTPAAFLLANSGSGYGNIMVGHADVIDGAVTNTKRDELVAYLKADSVAPMFPTTQPLVSVIGDSIGVPFGATTPDGWPTRMLANVRAVYPDAQLLNYSISGSGIATTSGNGSTQFTTIANRISNARSKQVVIQQQGTNNLVGNTTDAQVDAFVAAQFALADANRAAGAKVLLVKLLPRSGLLGGTTQSDWNHARARYDAALAAGFAAHADGLIDLAAIAGMGADGDSDNAALYFDAVHPTAAGHALLEPAYTAAVLAVLADVLGPSAPKFQMQGVAASLGLVTWLADSPDWTGALAPVAVTDVVVYQRSKGRA